MGKAGKRKEMVKNLGGIRYVWKSKINVCVYRRRGEQRGTTPAATGRLHVIYGHIGMDQNKHKLL